MRPMPWTQQLLSLALSAVITLGVVSGLGHIADVQSASGELPVVQPIGPGWAAAEPQAPAPCPAA
jgi:hypothetical protein